MIEHEPAPRRVVAAFDFDGTLTKHDTVVPFLAGVAGWPAVARALTHVVLHAVSERADRDAAKARLVAAVLAGRDWGEVEQRAHTYAERVVQTGLRADTRRRLDWHREQGHDVVIVSASLDVYLHEVARRVGVDDVLCTTLECDTNGRVTGRLVGGNCRGSEKVNRLRSYVGAPIDTVELWAYGNGSGDAAMLEAATHAVRVSRRPLRALDRAEV